MAVLPDPVSRQHVDQDSDDLFQARQNINDALNAVNQIRDYLANLFGVGGGHVEAIATLFSNQAVLFQPGTALWFYNRSPPPGWIRMFPDIMRYLAITNDGTGTEPVGSYEVNLQSNPTALIREHLPAVTLTGVTDWQGVHNHNFLKHNSQYGSPPSQAANSIRAGSGDDKTYHYDHTQTTEGGGNHYHNFSVNLGGANWGHDHITWMGNYRPAGLKGILAHKS